jgi:hypothetical protein
MTQPGEVNKQEFFLAADYDFATAIDAADVAYDDVIDAKARVLAMREVVRDMEAECLVNGGRGNYSIPVGQTNDKKRDAIIRLALRDWPQYQEQRLALGEAERELDRAEARRDTALNRMARSRRRMDGYLAAANQRAAVLTVTQEATRPRGRN